LEQLVAPIALYPDQLVGQILTASVNSQEVLDAGNWLLQNQALSGDALDSAAGQAGFGPAMRALVQFPTVVDMMCQQIDWTRQLGAAFTSNQQAVLDAVQRLRKQAAAVGNLKSTPQQKVETHEEQEKTIIEVKPANPQVIYVPQYNPQVVYTTPPPAPVAAAPAANTVSTEDAVAGGLLAFGVGIIVGSAIQSNNYCYPHWGAGAVYVGPRPFYPPAYVYRPAYGAGFHPSYRYASPVNYRNAYNNTAVRNNLNVNVNNSNYFNQFKNDRNLTGAGRDTAQSWKGQSNYAGTRGDQRGAVGQSDAARQRGGAGQRDAGQRNATAQRDVAAQRNASAQRGASSQRTGSSSERATPTQRDSSGQRSAASQRDTSQRDTSGVRDGTAQRNTLNTGPTSNRSQSVDRGFGSGGPDRAPSDLSPSRNQAFSGGVGNGGGAFERAASARGHASAGSRFAGGGGGGGRPGRGNR
jgi:hypothetical protein